MIWFVEIWNDPLYRLVLFVSLGLMFGLVGVLGVIWSVRLRRQHLRNVSERTATTISAALFEFLAGNTQVEELVRVTRPFTVSQRATVLERYSATLAGASKDALGLYFKRSGTLGFASRMCRSVFWWNRLEGARILGAGAGSVGAEILLRLLRDPNLSVRLAAARALGGTGDPDHIEPLLRALRRGTHARAQIAEVLVTLGPDSRQRLRELVMQLPPDKRTSTLRATTVEVLALVGDAGATPFVQFALGTGDAEVRIAAYKAASILRLSLSPDEVRLGLRDPVWQVRAHAASMVGRCLLTSMVHDLGALLGDANWWVRINAARGLYALGSSGIALLENIASTHDDRFARGMALRVLTEDPQYTALKDLNLRLEDTGARIALEDV